MNCRKMFVFSCSFESPVSNKLQPSEADWRNVADRGGALVVCPFSGVRGFAEHPRSRGAKPSEELQGLKIELHDGGGSEAVIYSDTPGFNHIWLGRGVEGGLTYLKLELKTTKGSFRQLYSDNCALIVTS